MPGPSAGPLKRLRLTLWVLVRSLRMRLFANVLTVVAVLLGVGLALVVPLSLRAFQKGATEAAQIFDLLVTAEGSQTQAVLNTIYYQNAPIGNIPYRVYASLEADPRTARAVPLGFGDSVQGYPLVGTTPAYFELRASPQAPPYFRLEQGAIFSGAYQAVLGAQVAREIGFGLGDTFRTAHGFVETFEPTMHTDDYRVVGILAPTGGPSDRAVYTALESVWDSHGQFSPESGVVDAEHACAHMTGEGEALDDGRAGTPPPVVDETHTRYEIGLATLADADRGGSLRFSADEAGDYAFFADQSAILTLTDGKGATLTPELVAGEDEVEGCLDIFSAHVFQLEPGDHELQINAAERDTLALIVEEVGHVHEEEAHAEDEGREGVLPLESLADAPPGGSDTREVTAILYATEDLSALYQVAGVLDEIPGVQAVFPGGVINGLLSLLGQGRQTYGILANIILALAVITVALNTYANAVQAQKNLAVLRAVGVPRGVVAGSVLLEAALLSFVGIALGVLAAYLGVAFVGGVVEARASLALPTPELSRADLWRGLVLLPAAVLFALLPALRAARRSPLERL